MFASLFESIADVAAPVASKSEREHVSPSLLTSPPGGEEYSVTSVATRGASSRSTPNPTNACRAAAPLIRNTATPARPGAEARA